MALPEFLDAALGMVKVCESCQLREPDASIDSGAAWGENRAWTRWFVLDDKPMRASLRVGVLVVLWGVLLRAQFRRAKRGARRSSGELGMSSRPTRLSASAGPAAKQQSEVVANAIEAALVGQKTIEN
jgi:hypothetical protein